MAKKTKQIPSIPYETNEYTSTCEVYFSLFEKDKEFRDAKYFVSMFHPDYRMSVSQMDLACDLYMKHFKQFIGLDTKLPDEILEEMKYVILRNI